LHHTFEIKKLTQISIGITSGTEKTFLNSLIYILKLLRKQGTKPCFYIPKNKVAYIVELHDRFIISEGYNWDPLLYNENQIYEYKLEEDVKINFEISLLNEIINQGKPVLVICYGMQLINVLLEGILYQDIEFQIAKSLNHREGRYVIRVDSDPYIEKGEYEVNSSHHKAVKDLGLGIKPFAYATDNVVEAFSLDQSGFLMGVQWHPERMNHSLSNQIFKVFIEACNDYK
jgi:putative glutamine amidotransferase